MPDITAPHALRFDHHHGSMIGLGTPTPRISWQVARAPEGYRQTRYQLEIIRGGKTETFETESAEQVLVPWPAAPLKSREAATVRVRVASAAGDAASGAAGDAASGAAGDAASGAAGDAASGAAGDAGGSAAGHAASGAAGNAGGNAAGNAGGSAAGNAGSAGNAGGSAADSLVEGDAGTGESTGVSWSEWSEPATAEAGLLEPADWTARFVSPREIGAFGRPAPMLTGTFPLGSDVVKARLYITAHGLYEASLNGQRVGDEVLTPGWTAYQHRLRYQTYDVTDLVTAGENRLEVNLGNGWWRGYLGFRNQHSLYGDRLAALAQLEAETADGQVHTLASDGTWTAREGTIVDDDLYNGQRADLSRELGPESPVDVVDADLSLLVAPDGPPIRVTDVLPAVEVFRSPSGRTLVDFGQNVVGWVRLTVRGAPGNHPVVIRHAEVLEDGELGVRPLRTARATDEWIVDGPDTVILEPTFTFHGFRYAEVTGVGDLRAEDIEAVVVGSDLRRTGWFESDHDLLNRFHENVVWGMRGNFVDVPTDCPQRDERLGWTGDIQVFSPTASFLFDSAGFLTNWLADLAAEQQKDGSVPYVVPDVLRQPGPATAAWGDAATIVPWVIYQRTGDRALLERQLPSMRAWVDKMAALAGSDLLWAGGFQFGDWLDPTAPPADPFRAKADPDVIATAHLARSAQVVAQAALAVGDGDVAREYGDLAGRVREAFAREYVTGGGRVLSDAPTAYALALQWALLPTPEQRQQAGQRLADLVRVAGFRISTGFVGTPLMTDALADAGEPELAYRLLLQTGVPSWLYPVTMGATTVWERWDSMLPDGSINPGEMTSFNHYALGAVADWLHRRVAGLAPAEPGYRRIEVRPLPTGQLNRATARHLTPYGEASVTWTRDGGQLRLDVVVPVGATATVHVPGRAEPIVVGHGRHDWTVQDPYGQEGARPAEPSIRQLMDHKPSWDKVVALAAEAGVATDEADLAGRLERYLGAPATELAGAATAHGFIPGGDVLAARLQTLLSSDHE
ncbi:alpha-L-rhamnosidase [Paractinoplanes abujensis]|uniref:family 78 glycoside hydrolase catalytic domain n=1 Tax=Paractinoplanes abujensis TaxID=882441 RepID=UPI001A40A333|nr:family 78 glycoside hydrolase catalytic domain [Actinoplanes abujensis]GID17897.1 alpha-L-rhamnosidase [Actinoplanes abujensis]